MADLSDRDKVIAALLILPSLAAWGWIVQRWRTTGEPLPYRPREPLEWEPGVALLAFGVAFVSRLFVVADPASLESVQLSAALAVLQILVVLGLFAATGPLREADFGVDSRDWTHDLRVGGLGFLASLIPVYAVNVAVERAGWRAPEGQHPFFKILQAHPGMEAVVWIGVSVVVCAPLAEELMYRVVLQGWLKTRLPPAQAVVIAAALFAVVHVGEGRPDFLPLFPLALILGYVYHRRHSFLAVVMLHALFNALNLALFLLGGGSK